MVPVTLGMHPTEAKEQPKMAVPNGSTKRLHSEMARDTESEGNEKKPEVCSTSEEPSEELDRDGNVLTDEMQRQKRYAWPGLGSPTRVCAIALAPVRTEDQDSGRRELARIKGDLWPRMAQFWFSTGRQPSCSGGVP